MEPPPLIPRIQTTITPEMGCLVREVFQDAFQSDTANWQISINLAKSCAYYPNLRQIAAEIQAEIIEHKETLDELEYAEIKIMESHGYYICRDQGMRSNERAIELIRLKRHPLYIDLHPDIIEKYPLLQSDDLLPPIHECATDFRLDNRDRIKMKERLYRSRDSSLNEIPLRKFTSRGFKFDSITDKKSGRLKSKEKSLTMRMGTHKRSIIRSEYPKTVLVAEPEELFFHNFEYNKMYKKIVLIKNVSTSMARYKVERRLPNSKFTILFDTEAIESSKIAPGMHVKLTVIFLCDVIEDPKEFLVINVQSGKTVCVKMHAYRDPPILRAFNTSNQIDMLNGSSSFLSIFEGEGEHEIHDNQLSGGDKLTINCNAKLGANFECGKCFVGERIVTSIRFVNDGGDGRFFIMSEIDWCTMNVDDIMDCNIILIPPFAIWPIYFALRSGEYIEIRIYFYPESYGTQVDKLYILCDNHAIHPAELIGDGILYDPKFLRFSDNVEKTKSPVNGDESSANYRINVGETASGETIEIPLLVSNTSGLGMYYRWQKYLVKNSNPESSWASLPIENSDIQPAEGFFNSNSITSFRVFAQTEDLHMREYRAILRLYIEDIPLAAIPKDFNPRITECCTKRRNCPITVDILVADIEVCVHCTPVNCETSLHPGISDGTESVWRWSDESEKLHSLNDSYLSSSSMTAVETLSKDYSTMSNNPSICDMENVQCNKHYIGMENSENLWNAVLGVTENLDINTGARTIPRLEFHYKTGNTAILIPERPLYVGIKQAYILTLRNISCKSLAYVWGKPLEKNGCRMKVRFNPENGFIPPTNTATIEVTCLPMEPGAIDNFFIPCFIGGRLDPIILGIECTVNTMYVTFLFLPAPSDALSACLDSVRVEWHKDGRTSGLNLNNLKMNRYSKTEEERELKNIDLDAGEVVATAAVGATAEDTEHLSIGHFSETPFTAEQEFDTLYQNKTQNKSAETTKLRATATTELGLEEVETSELRSWESLIKGIIWTEDKPEEYISLIKPQATVPFYRTIVPPITQALAVEFVDLPLRTVEKRTFVIRNETPAESTFHITLKHFGSMEVIEELNPSNRIDMTYANVMGNKSENYWEEIMPPGQGIVFLIEPTCGAFAPYETVPIDIYVYADTWGIYVDEITIAIFGLPDYVFGLCAQVVGSPMAYPICKNGLNEIPVLRFGSLSFGTESVTRKIVIENTSSVSLIVNWYSYIIDPRLAKDDSMPFNVILRMFSPFTDKIASMTSTGLTNAHKFKKVPTVDSTTERSQQSRMDSDECDSVRTSMIIETISPLSNCPQTETKDQFLQTSTLNSTLQKSGCETLVSSDQIISQDKEDRRRNNPDYVYEEYATESEIKSVSLSEETIPKETDLELNLISYYGQPDYSIFTVSPPEIIIPVRGKQLIEVTINIRSDELRMENCKNEISGCLIGFIRAAPMHKYKADCYSRNDGTMLKPAKIQLEATISQPTLSQEFTNTDRTFKVFASSVFTHFGRRIKIRRKFVFRNNEVETMFVNVHTTEPFQVLSISTTKSKINPSESNGIFVPPGQCLEVGIVCSVNASWIDKAMETSRYQTAEDPYVDITESLLISHVGSCNQVVPLSLRIYLPLLKLSTHNIKFGTVYVGDSKRINLAIENISREKQILNIRGKNSNKDYAISPNQGILSFRDRTLDVVITFTASIILSTPNYIQSSLTIMKQFRGFQLSSFQLRKIMAFLAHQGAEQVY